MPAPGDPQCGLCKFWVGDGANAVIGDCHRYPPSVLPSAAAPLKFQALEARTVEPDWLRVSFARTHHHDWCGEYTKTVP